MGYLFAAAVFVRGQSSIPEFGWILALLSPSSPKSALRIYVYHILLVSFIDLYLPVL